MALGMGGYATLGIALADMSGLAVLPHALTLHVQPAFGGGAARPWASSEPAARMHHGR